MSHLLLCQGESRALPLRDATVQCIVTSPPYYGLRSYLADGDSRKAYELGAEPLHDCLAWARGAPPCEACYLCHLRTVVGECWRILRTDGVLFVVISDSYARDNHRTGVHGGKHCKPLHGSEQTGHRQASGLARKNLCGIPQRLALALQADGWIWRSDIVWWKANAMPESVQDRPTRDHESVLLFTKSQRYFWDAEAVREEGAGTGWKNGGILTGAYTLATQGRVWRGERHEREGRNLRTVWNIPTIPYDGAHYAVFPPALAERCILAGTSAGGCCPICRVPWKPQREKTGERRQMVRAHGDTPERIQRLIEGKAGSTLVTGYKFAYRFLGYTPGCTCPVRDPIPCLVCDPFVGSGTTLLVARQLGRHGIGLDLDPQALAVARERLGLQALARWEGREQSPVPVTPLADLPLFQA